MGNDAIGKIAPCIKDRKPGIDGRPIHDDVARRKQCLKGS